MITTDSITVAMFVSFLFGGALGIIISFGLLKTYKLFKRFFIRPTRRLHRPLPAHT